MDATQAANLEAELRKALQAEVAKVERGEKELKENKEEMEAKYLGLGGLHLFFFMWTVVL